MSYTDPQPHARPYDGATMAQTVPCPYCGGVGEITTTIAGMTGETREFKQRCIVCGGSGKALVDSE